MICKSSAPCDAENVVRVLLQVKFMKSVPGTALVEMGDEYAVDRAITHLNSIKVFSKRLNVWYGCSSLTNHTSSLINLSAQCLWIKSLCDPPSHQTSYPKRDSTLHEVNQQCCGFVFLVAVFFYNGQLLNRAKCHVFWIFEPVNNHKQRIKKNLLKKRQTN